MEGNKNGSKTTATRSKRDSQGDNKSKKLASNLPAKQTKTSKLREEMNARKMSQKHYKSEPDVRKPVKEDTITPHVNDVTLYEPGDKSKECYQQMDEAIKTGCFVDDQQKKYIVISEEENKAKEEESKKLHEQIVLSNNQHTKLQNVITDLESRIKTYDKKLADVNFSLETIQKDNKMQKDELQKKYKETQNELNKERKEIEDFCNMYKEKLKQYEIEQKHIENENKAMLHDLKLKVLSHEHRNFENIALNDLVGLISNIEIINSALGENLISVEKENEKLKHDHETLISENENFSKIINDTKLKCSDLETEITKLREDNETFSKSSEKEIDELKNLCQKKNEDIKSLEEQLMQSECKMKDYKNEISQYNKSIENKELFIDELKSKINSLEENIITTCDDVVLKKKENESLTKLHGEEIENLKQELRDNLKNMEDKNSLYNNELKAVIILQKENSNLKAKQTEMDEIIKVKNEDVNQVNEKVNLLLKEDENKVQQIKKLTSEQNTAQRSHQIQIQNLIESSKKKEDELTEEIKLNESKLYEQMKNLKEMKDNLEKHNFQLRQNVKTLKEEIGIKNKEIETLKLLVEENKDNENYAKSLRQEINSLTAENTILKGENKKVTAKHAAIEKCLDELKMQYKIEVDNYILSDETKTQKIEQMMKNTEDQKEYFEKLMNEKSTELSDLQADLEMIEDILEKKDEELSSLKEQVRIIEIQAQERSKVEKKKYEEILHKEHEQLEDKYNDKLALQEARIEMFNMGKVEKLKNEYMKQIEELTLQRNDLVDALKARSDAVSKEIVSVRKLDNLQLELNKKGYEVESLTSELQSREKLIIFLSNMLEKERKEVTGSSKEILSKLNDITVSLEQHESHPSALSRENSIDSFLNSSSIPNSDEIYFPDLNTTWPRDTPVKHNPIMKHRSYDSLLSGQTILKEQISNLKYDINMKIQDLQRDKGGRAKGSNESLGTYNKQSSPNNAYRKKQISALEDNLKDLNNVYYKIKDDELPHQNERSDSFNSWKTKTEASIKEIQVKFDSNSPFTSPFSITSSIVYHPSKAEVQTIIDDVNKKYTAMHSDTESM